ncbi:MAG TPA: hypothetical protein ENI04_01475 [Candidatus Wildermuthbacteria bacterium]|nr:hypothetical protein [Candidatus Wildermuthbacteria bacterium]
MKGATLLEVIIGIAVLFILVAIALPSSSTKKTTDIQIDAQQIVSTLSLARSRTTASESASQHGVFFDVVSSSYTLFEGSDYISRDIGEDQVFELSSSVEISSVSFAGGNEIVFERIYGSTLQSGSLVLELVSDPSVTSTVLVAPSGQINTSSPLVPSDNDRVVDSRHVHIEYVGRDINTSTENIVLTFPTATEIIPISDNMSGGEIVWSSTIMVDGEEQQLSIQTHRLNDIMLGTQLSIKRDRGFNTKALEVSLSGDVSGEIIIYTALGELTPGTSIYASTPDIQ